MDLPDFPVIKDSTQPNLAGLAKDADWARTFGPGETNLARRNAKATTVDEYNSALQQAHQQQVMQQIQTGKNAFNFWKTTQEMAQKERMHAADMAVAAPLKQAQLAAHEAAADAHRANMMHVANQDARTAAKEKAITDAKENYSKAAADLSDKYGPTAPPDQQNPGLYHTGILQAARANPFAPEAHTKADVEAANKYIASQPEAQDTIGFQQHMSEIAARGVAPQSDEWQSALAIGHATFPKAKTSVVSQYGPAQMPSPLKAENLQARTLSTQAGTEAKIAGVDLAKAREARLQSQLDRKLSDADTAKEDTIAFLADAARLHEKIDQGTPEYRNGMADLVAAYPNADPKRTKAFMGLAGIADSDAQALRVRAQDFREKMALRSADQRDSAAKEKGALSANELALRQRSESFKEASALTPKPQQEAAALDKEITAIEKKRPVWMKTTGIFKDDKGVERFGFPEGNMMGENNKSLSRNETPVVTPELEAEYRRYQNLVLRRAAHAAGMPIKKFNPETGKIE